MYDHTAVLVRWVDYESKAISAENADIILSTISNFELALAEVVRVVYECQLINSAGGDGHFATLPSKRRCVCGSVYGCVCFVKNTLKFVGIRSSVCLLSMRTAVYCVHCLCVLCVSFPPQPCGHYWYTVQLQCTLC